MACKRQRLMKFELSLKSGNIIKDFVANVKETEFFDGQIVKSSDGFGPFNERSVDYESNDFLKLRLTMMNIENNLKKVDEFTMSWRDVAEVPNFSCVSEKFQTWCEVGLD